MAAFIQSSRGTVRREQERYAQGGMVGLGRTQGWRRGRRRVSGKRLRSIESLKSQGLSNRAIAQRLGVNEKAIRKLAGPSKDDEVEQLALATISNTPASEPPFRSALSLEELRERAPAAFAIGAHERTSRSYTFISTVAVLNALAEAGFMPVEARQSSQRAASPSCTASHPASPACRDDSPEGFDRRASAPELP